MVWRYVHPTLNQDTDIANVFGCSWRKWHCALVSRLVPPSGQIQGNFLILLLLGTSVILLVVYGAYLFFQLKSHVEIYNKPSEKTEKRGNKKSEGDASKGLAQIGRMGASLAGQNEQLQIVDPEDEAEEPQLHIWVAVFTLAASTVLVALCAEFMVGTVPPEAVTRARLTGCVRSIRSIKSPRMAVCPRRLSVWCCFPLWVMLRSTLPP